MMQQVVHSLRKSAVPAILALAVVITLSALSGCTQSGLVPGSELESKSSNTEFVLGPEDVLEVVVWRNQDLSRQVIVRPDGMISMPVIGDVRVGGWVAALHPAIHPAGSKARRPLAKQFPGTPVFGDDSVPHRPDKVRR